MGKNETYLTKNQISCELGRSPLDCSSCRTSPSFRPVRLPSGPGPCVPAVDPADPAAEISRVSGVASHLCSRFLCSGPGFPLGDSSGQYLDLLSPRPCACGAEKPSKCLVDFCAKSEPLSVAQEALPGRPWGALPTSTRPLLSSLRPHPSICGSHQARAALCPFSHTLTSWSISHLLLPTRTPPCP